MEPSHFESLYPKDSYQKEIEKLFGFIKEGNSCQIIGLPGVGRSILLRLLAYNRSVRMKHVGENQKWYHFVLCNVSEVTGRSLFDVTKFLFLSLADSLRDRNLREDHDAVHKIFQEHLSLNDELVLFQGLKEAITFLAIEKQLTVVFLFDRFETYIPTLTSLFFSNLRALRDTAKYRFSAVFSINRPLDETLEPAVLSDFYEFLAGNNIYLPIQDTLSLDFRIAYLKKSTEKTISKELLQEVTTLTGSHGKLTRLSLEQILSHNKQDEKNISKSDLLLFLLSTKPVIKTLSEIWDSFTPSEQKMLISDTKDQSQPYLEQSGILKDNTITIPLFAQFLAQNLLEKKPEQEHIVFREQTNEIVKGTTVLSDNLTSAEFRLLKFLIANKERVIERDEVIHVVWQGNQSIEGVTDQALDQLIFRLRKKIEPDVNNPIHLQTIKGRGFRFLP